jgi:dephospho-CoA kinase
MRILLTGPAGSGKTTCRLQLRSMMPHFTFYVRSVEGEAQVFLIGESDPVTFEDPYLDYAQQMTQPNIVYTIARYADVAPANRLAVDCSVYIHCGVKQRVERLLARNPDLTPEIVADHISHEPIDIEYETTCDYSFDTSGDRDSTTQTLIHFVDQLNLRPPIWDPTDIARMRHLYL